MQTIVKISGDVMTNIELAVAFNGYEEKVNLFNSAEIKLTFSTLELAQAAFWQALNNLASKNEVTFSEDEFLTLHDSKAEILNPEKITFALASWFTGTCLNDIEHPIYGKHQISPGQLVRAGNEYRNQLWACIRRNILSGEITADQLVKFNNL